ncbi:MAG: hypothetical protein KKA60_10335 [Proteobacteria bacterium]|nr:hypothetical protein [Pseudomonadota bacterium]
MDETREKLAKHLADLEEQVLDQEARLPAHSVRPHQIQELERLEEERDQARAELEVYDQSQKKGGRGPAAGK